MSGPMDMLLAGASPRDVHEAAERAHRAAEDATLPRCTACGGICEAGRFADDGHMVSVCCGAMMKRPELPKCLGSRICNWGHADDCPLAKVTEL